jgi:hypothetical protein
MINKNNFYRKEDLPGEKSKRKMWKKIKKSGRDEFYRQPLNKRSYLLGFVSAIVVLFAIIGIYTTVKNFIYTKQPDDIKINRAYADAIDRLENIIPASVERKDNSVRVDEILHARYEELKTLDTAIYDFSNGSGYRDLSPIKQKKLRELYRTKLKVLNNIIELEGGQK